MSAASNDPRLAATMMKLAAPHLQAESLRKERLDEIDKEIGAPERIPTCKSCWTKLDGRPHRPKCMIQPENGRVFRKRPPEPLFKQDYCPSCNTKFFVEVGTAAPNLCDKCQKRKRKKAPRRRAVSARVKKET